MNAPHHDIAGAAAAVERDVTLTAQRWRGAVRRTGG